MTDTRGHVGALPTVVSVPLVVAVTTLAGAVSAGVPLPVALAGSTGCLLVAALAVSST
ncbi:hypothetical protein [Halomarina rubra]|uniref:Uncharacterized protein n=1 Tax=Halomarina rubra TaxID=2071873 RepID=A0ABD6B1Q6_9EURY|nr:hypothetical protein [Halomarina rubra]